MKKYLSLVLACLMVLSSVAYAVPVAVGTVETANETTVDVTEVFEVETTEETADLQDESEYGRLVYSLDLEQTGTLGVANNGGEVSTNWYNWQQVPKNSSFYEFSGFDTQMYFLNYNGNDKLYVADDGTGNKAFKFDAHYKWSRLNLIAGAATSYYPAGDYTLVYDVWVDDNYDWSTSHIAEVSTSVVFSGTTSATMLSSPVAKLKSGTNKLTNTVKFRTVANTTNRFQIMQDTPWNNENKDLVVTNDVSNLTLNYYLDNIKLYYQGPATVTFSSSVEAAVPEAVSNVLPGTKLNLSSYKATAEDERNEFLGWSLTEGGTIVNDVEVLKDTTLYAVYAEAEKIVDETKGQLVYWLDFDNVSKTASIFNYYETTTKHVFAPATMPKAKDILIRINNAGSSGIADGALFMQQAYPRFHLETDADNPFPEGFYTFEWAAKTDVALNDNSVIIYGTDTTVWPTTQTFAVSKGTGLNIGDDYVVSTANFKYADKTVTGNTSTRTNVDGLGKIGLQMFNKNTGSDHVDRQGNRYIDYVKIYYSPFYDITYNANGKDMEDTVLRNVDLFNPSKAQTLPDTGSARFVGWSTTPDGEVLTENRVFGKDTTLYAVWDEHYYESADEKAAGELVISFNYNNMGIGNHHSNIWIYGTTEGERFAELIYGGTKPTSGPWFPQGDKNADDTWVYGFKYGEYGVVGSYKHPDNAFLIDQKITDGATKFPKVYLPAGSILKDGIYTMFVEVSVTLAKNATVAADSFVNVKLKGESEYKDMAVNKAALALDGEKYYLKKTIFVKDGYYGSYDSGTMMAIDGVAKSKFGFNFTVAPVDPEQDAHAKIECDNFKLYYKPYDYAPKSYNENSIRVSTPAGIRFKSSVSTLERNNAKLTEYGFIVALKDSLGETNVNDFTHESTFNYAEGKSYDTANNVDRFFETQGNTFFFTAVVYNIPASKYATDLVVRPYALVDGEYVYGDAMVNNIAAVAEKIKASPEYETYKTEVDKILAGKELD